MKTLKFIMYLFYRYYSKGGTKNIPYFSALCAVAFLIYIHIFQLLMIFGKVGWIPIEKDDLRIVKYGKFALFVLPIFLLIYYLVKPSDLMSLEYDKDKIRKGGIILIIYIIANLALLFVLMFIVRRP